MSQDIRAAIARGRELRAYGGARHPRDLDKPRQLIVDVPKEAWRAALDVVDAAAMHDASMAGMPRSLTEREMRKKLAAFAAAMEVSK